MNNKDSGILKDKLKILFKIFEKKPNLLVKYFIEYNILDPDFLDKLNNNTEIDSLLKSYDSENIIKTPHFKDLEDMQKYYNLLFEENNEKIKHPILGCSTGAESLSNQLKSAIYEQKYEKAAKIRDYIKTLGIKIEDFL